MSYHNNITYLCIATPYVYYTLVRLFTLRSSRLFRALILEPS